MNNIFKLFRIYFIVGSICIVASCVKLDDKSYSDIIATDFEPNSEDLGALVGKPYSIWSKLYSPTSRGYWTIQEETADALVRARKPYGFFDGGIHQLLHFHTWDAENTSFELVWNAAFEGVSECNKLIFQIESGLIPITEVANKDAVVSELRVLRASYYYVLIDVFGNVPLITEFDVPPGFLPEQVSREVLYDFIIKEILESIPNLSDENNESTYGRFNNVWSANALLAKMYLNSEVWTNKPRWEECISACDEIINSERFELEAIQKQVFSVNNHQSKELIWTIPYDETFAPGFGLNIITLPLQSGQTFNLQQVGWGGLISIPQFIDTYDEDDLRLTDGWLYGPQYSSSGELLLVNTGKLAGTPLIIVNELPGIDSSEEVHSYRIFKYEVEMGSDPARMSNDVPMIRYADILLMKAESLLRLNRPGAGELVSQVRSRNFLINPEKAQVTDEQLMESSSYEYGIRDYLKGRTQENDPIMFGSFLDELGREFAAEAHRRQDMIRFGIFNSRSRLSFQANDQEFRNLGPIPLSALNTNPNLKQNPGY